MSPSDRIQRRDSIGTRFKEQYENRALVLLPRRTYTIIRADGKAFHSYTRKLSRPFDSLLIQCMDWAAVTLCESIQGTNLGYVQSDEISLILTDFATKDTAAWYDNNLQKVVSVSSSIATMAFNERARELGLHPTATFDARAFVIPDREEVMNYFVWRQQDATRNSIQSVAQSMYSPKELNGKNCDMLQEMIFQKGTNWNDLIPTLKHGRAIIKGEQGWMSDPSTPVFTQDRAYLGQRIPVPGY